MIDASAYQRYIEGVRISKEHNGMPTKKLFRQQYVMRCGLCWLIQHTIADYALTNPIRLRIAYALSNPEVESQPQRWAALFEEKSDEAKARSFSESQVYAFASDLCASVVSEPQGDHATATDGNGDVQLSEVA